ncbi:MAG: DUF1553 domain-containing protein [Verrucomicrobia bacterium]|nr:DUF1553 domain-containing protein [Verrucomicrobiota bacterium]
MQSAYRAVAVWVTWAGLIGLKAQPPLASPSDAVVKTSPVFESTFHVSRFTNHWAFQTPVEPPVPQVKNPDRARSPIDLFILAKLEEKGLAFSPPADRRTLARRAAFDLTGLPPTSEEVDSFAADQSPEAFARLVDRLLASPHYGERWGRYWLDVARYADTKGYVYGDREEARFIHSYAYRDWVIQAFNQDMPYDRFLLLQIAADQAFPSLNARSSTPSADLAALGFLTLGRRFLGVIHDIIDDRIDVLMRGTQALTVGCARCHDHKFDPISTKDYYALYGVFASCTEGMIPLAAARGPEKLALAFEQGLKERAEKYDQTMRQKREEFSNRFRTKATDYLVAVLDVKKLPTEEHYEIRGPDDLNPTIVRNWENYLLQTKKDFHPVFAPWHAFEALPAAEFAQSAPQVLQRLKSDGLSRGLNGTVVRVLEEQPLNTMREVAERYGMVFAAAHQRWQEELKRAATNHVPAPAVLPDRDLEELRQVLYGSNAPVNIPVLAAADLEWYFDEPTRVQLMKLHAEIERWIIKSAGAPPYAVALEDRPNPKNARVFVRGNPANKGDEVPRQFLEVLRRGTSRPFEHGSGRLELAQAITSKENPLTGRVMVNRIWHHHFGAGLVRTPSDFGTRCEPPSHPELLDWLACRFMKEGWSIKQLHRSIMLSSVYQQSSDGDSSIARALALRIDPENRLLWKMSRRRQDFEALRDSLFAVTGELDARIGGAPVELLKPPFLSRRTVYGLIDRQFLPGALRVFDFANPDMHSPQRPETTVPQQALFFMNSPFAVERARALIQRREIAELNESAGRVQKLFHTVFQRQAEPQEVQTALSFVKAAEALPLFQLPPPPVPVWHYGYGEFDEAAVRVKSFTLLPHFSGDGWQGGDKWPDAQIGWVRLTADGGHTGNDLRHASIRRWTAPMDGIISISGTIRHEHDAGDGVRARIVSSRQGAVGTWTVHKNKAETKVEALAVEKSDTVDFVVDLNGNLNSDDFVWSPIIKMTSGRTDGSVTGYPTEWNAKKDFSGPPIAPPRPLTPWEQYAQVLLLSNEFVFVD